MVPPVADSVVVAPWHRVAVPDVAVTVGIGLTVINCVVVLEQVPVALTVYVVVTDGDAVTKLPVVALSPVDGDQE